MLPDYDYAAAVVAARKHRWRCGLCRKKIRPIRDEWVTRLSDNAPVHALCALTDPRVVRVDIERLPNA